MSGSGLPPQDLLCPDARGCPVPGGVAGSDFVLTVMPAGADVFRCYDGVRGHGDVNPGYGDTRFQPFDDAGGRRVPTVYVAETQSAALLETVFHEVHQSASRRVYQADLVGRLVARLRVPEDLHLVDLRDAEMSRLGIPRDALVSTTAEHYPCTRGVAAALHSRLFDGVPAQGLVWHSRQAELAGGPPAEVAVVFADRLPEGAFPWPLARPGLRALFEGPGRDAVDEIALTLGATVVQD